jgi:uncharacterized protein YdbL (DUF1318 family)
MDLLTLIKILIILAIVILPALNRMLMQLREQRGAAQGPPRPKPGPEQPARNEIEEFLRRAASRGAAGSSAAGSGEAAGKQPSPRRAPGGPPALPGRTTGSPVEAEVVDEKAARGRVGEHVKTYLDASEFQRRSASLADDIAEAEEKRTERRQEVFGHAVGQLGAEAAPAVAAQDLIMTETAADVPPPAFDLGALFAQPANLRQAILMQEILQRPEHRWS